MLTDGSIISRDTAIVFTFREVPGCDSIHIDEFLFAPLPTRRDTTTICPDETIIFGDQIIDQPGRYVQRLPSLSCDTILTLVVAQGLPDTVQIDTVIASGEVFEFEGVEYNTAGRYTYVRQPQKEDCGTVFFINLDFTNSIVDQSDLDVWHPNPIRVGNDLYFSAGSKLQSFSELTLFNAQGQIMGGIEGSRANSWNIPAHWPAGLYLYRVDIYTALGRQTITGKLLIIR